MATLACAAPVRDGHVEAELLSEAPSLAPGTSFWIGVRLRMDPGWHTYWINPGDTGLGTSIKWNLPEGLEAGPIQWPCPERIEDSAGVSYGYRDEAILLTRITVSPTFKSEASVHIGCRVKWLMCEEKCVPGSADLPLDFPATAVPLEKALELLPKSGDAWKFKSTASGHAITLQFDNVSKIQVAYFFPSNPDVLDHSAKQPLVVDTSGSRILLARSPYADGFPEKLEGVLLINNDAQNAVVVDVPIETKNEEISK